MGPREIDIDFLFYGSEIVIEEDLTVPHPLIQDRIFVLRAAGIKLPLTSNILFWG